MVKSRGGVVFRTVDDRVEYLIVKSSRGNYYGLPKGRVDGNESETQTARREILEETNYFVKFEVNFKEKVEFVLPEGEDKEMILFLAKAIKESSGEIDDEITEVIWCSYQEAMKLLSFDDFKDVLKKANDYINNNQLTFIESRCGILCTQCEYRESMNCQMCINIDNPFWGTCKVKECCENKKLEHCGQCKEFPCQLLESFAYDKGQGDDGKRIKQCRMWSK